MYKSTNGAQTSRALPSAHIIVCRLEAQAGASVFRATTQGKSNALRRMFRDTDAVFLKTIKNKIDFVSGVRIGMEKEGFFCEQKEAKKLY